MYAPIIAIVCYIALLVLLITYLLLRSLRKNLSKRADWLKKINVVLGFIEASMGMKFLMTSDQCMHWGLLNREVYLTIQILIFLFMGLYLVWPSIAFIIGKVRHTQDVNIKDFPAISLALAIAAFSVVAYLMPGLSGDPLTKISGYLPPMTSHTKYIDAKRKYADFLNLPHNLSGHFDFEEAVADAKAQNKPIFIDVTGHACNNCREMENYVWSDPKVKRMLEEDFVICALYVDDNTKIEGGERLGSKNAAFAQKKWGVNTQPTYLLLTPDGKEVIAGPRGYDRSIDGFVEFLETGKTGVK
jgi:thiol:disulfide interchange protein DsbD